MSQKLLKSQSNMERVTRSKVQKLKSTSQQLMDDNSKTKKRRSRKRSRKLAKIIKNMTKKIVSPEPKIFNETFQNISPLKVPETTINDDVISVIDTTDDSQHENFDDMPSKSTVPIIENDDIIDITNISTDNTSQNDFPSTNSKIKAPKFEDDEIIDITDTTVYEDKTITKKPSFTATSCDDNVQFITSSSSALSNKVVDVIILDSSDEENTPHQQPIVQSSGYLSVKEHLSVPVNLTNTKKRKYNSPLRSCKRTKIDEFRSNFLNDNLGGFVIDKQSISHISNNLKNIGHNATTLPRKHVPLSSTSSMINKQLRPIIIDGLNIGHAHGGRGNFSVKGIDICIKYFAKRGHSNIIAFIPQHWQGPPGSESNTLLNQLLKKGHICYTPSRKVQNLRMTCHDDRIILDYAHRCGGVVVSNDNFRDMYNESDAFKDIIENRQVMVTFVRDEIIVPEDQYNRRSNVHSLSDILCFPS